ncbi:hypothetical protein REPUB_Repub19eG0063300 [Reevesia pubescens]
MEGKMRGQTELLKQLKKVKIINHDHPKTLQLNWIHWFHFQLKSAKLDYIQRRGKKEIGKKMKPLGLWLMLVRSLRLASVWFGFFDIWALRLAVFSNTARTSIIWMLLQWNAHQQRHVKHS